MVMMMKMVTEWEQMTLLTCIMAGDVNKNTHSHVLTMLHVFKWALCLNVFICVQCVLGVTVWGLYMDTVYTVCTQAGKDIRHYCCTEGSWMFHVTASVMRAHRDTALGQYLWLCRVMTDQTEHVRVYTHIQVGAGRYDKQHGKVTFSSDSQLAKHACQSVLSNAVSDRFEDSFSADGRRVFEL